MFNLDNPKIKRQDLYLWADYIELHCINDSDHFVATADALDELNYQGEALGALFAESDEVLTPENSDSGLLSKSDEVEVNRADIVQIIENRVALFEKNYPFEVCHKSTISLKPNIDDLHRIYINQLIAANSRLLCEKSLASQYNTYFERLSIYLLRLIFPDPFHIKHAGTTPPEGFVGYGGNFGEKMKQISKDIHADLQLEDSELRKHSGDGGLDGIAWYDFGDAATHLPVILMQAGCTFSENEMLNKSKHISQHNWTRKFKHLQALSFMFTPQCYRDSLGNWPMPSDLGSVLIDRYRIIHLLGRADSASALAALKFGLESSPSTVDEILAQ